MLSANLTVTIAQLSSSLFAETSRLSLGPVRSRVPDRHLLDTGSAVVRGRHGASCDARQESDARVRSQDTRRTTADRRRQVRHAVNII